MVRKKVAVAQAPPPEDDPFVGSGYISGRITASQNHARVLMVSGAFGTPVDIGTGEGRARLRVRKSAVEAWLRERELAS